MAPLLRPLVLVLVLAGVSSAPSPSELVLDIRPSGAPLVPPRPFTASVAEFAWADGFPEQDLSTEPETPWRRNMDIVRRHAATAAQQVRWKRY